MTSKYNTYTMQGAIDYECSRHAMANQFINQFYTLKMRPQWNNEEGKLLQRADIDAIAEDRRGKYVKISEKFRSDYYSDILVELYRDLDKGIEGWGLHSQADFYHYWMRRKVYEIPVNDITNVCQFFMNTGQEAIEQFISEGMKRMDFFFLGVNEELDEPIEMSFISNPTFGKSSKILWKNLTLAIPFKVLKYFNIPHHLYTVDKELSTKDKLIWKLNRTLSCS